MNLSFNKQKIIDPDNLMSAQYILFFRIYLVFFSFWKQFFCVGKFYSNQKQMNWKFIFLYLIHMEPSM